MRVDTFALILTRFCAMDIILRTSYGYCIEPKTRGQSQIQQATQNNDVVFVQGPAGTGKTFVSLALAVGMLRREDVGEVMLTRPAVQAGEDLGFLPGELHEKLDPYMRPLYNALHKMLEPQEVHNLRETGKITYQPLGFLRGQTINECVLLDEAQNATRSQLEMFLTRLGPSATAFVTGDPEQTDLPQESASALYDAEGLLSGINNITFVNLTEDDIVRHQIVKDVITAYRSSGQTETEYKQPGHGLNRDTASYKS